MIKKLGLVSIASVGLLISPLTIAASLDAKVEWAERVSLSVPVSGIVSQVTVETGQNIKPGQILLRLDQDPFKTALQEAKAKKARRPATGMKPGVISSKPRNFMSVV